MRLPLANATVAAVATSYLNGALRQDCAFTAALTLAPTLAWCTSPTMTAYRNLAGPVLLSKKYAGRDEQCMSFEMTTTESSDHSLPPGDSPWNLCLIDTPGGWRLYDQGHL